MFLQSGYFRDYYKLILHSTSKFDFNNIIYYSEPLFP